MDSFFTTALCIITISIIIFIFVNENEIVVCNWSCNPFWASCLLLHMGIFRGFPGSNPLNESVHVNIA